MLKIILPEIDCWDDAKQEFFTYPGNMVLLEHSLLAISRWETKYHKPFLDKKEKSEEELLYYIRCMSLNDMLEEEDVIMIVNNQGILKKIKEYLDDPATATTIKKKPSGAPKSSSFVTSELIYYWMVSLQIPFECEKWNLNRLIKLIEVCDAKNTPPKKMSRSDLIAKHRSTNAARRAKYAKKH